MPLNDAQKKVAELQGNGWTLAAIAYALGVTVNAVEKWKAGHTYPRNVKGVRLLFDVLLSRKRISKKRRYGSGGRRRVVGVGGV